MRTKIYLTAADHGRALSWEQFASADAQEGYRYEMIEGRVFVSPAARLTHELLDKWITRKLSTYGEQRPDVLSQVLGSARVFLPNSLEGVTAPEPDIACYAEFPADALLGEVDWLNVSPVLVVEILSEDTKDKDLQRNRRLYVAVPTIQEYWIVDPLDGANCPSLLVYRRRGRRWAACITVASGATYTTPLLPGFSLLMDPLT